MSALIAQLKQTELAGLVLEVGKVMKATRLEPRQAVQLCRDLSRVAHQTDKKRGAPVYLDPKDVFFTNLEAAAGERSRSYVRKTVHIECSFSQEEDPSMAEPQKGTILDISSGGCFINTRQFSEKTHFLHICIPELGCNRPVFSSVRWTTNDGRPRSLRHRRPVHRHRRKPDPGHRSIPILDNAGKSSWHSLRPCRDGRDMAGT